MNSIFVDYILGGKNMCSVKYSDSMIYFVVKKKTIYRLETNNFKHDRNNVFFIFFRRYQ